MPELDEMPIHDAATWRPMLAAKPCRNRAARVDDLGANQLRVTVQKRRPRWLIPPISWVIRPNLESTMVLDPLGVSIWTRCDGECTVEEIIDGFATTHGLTFHEARVSVTEYLRGLVQRGALAVVMADHPHGHQSPLARPDAATSKPEKPSTSAGRKSRGSSARAAT